MRHFLLTRSAYGSAWSPEANRRRLEMTAAVTVPTIAAQVERRFEWLVMLHPADALLDERRALYEGAGARVLFLPDDIEGDPSQVAYRAYRAGWTEAIGPRRDTVLMTRLDDDDGLAPWVMARVRVSAARLQSRTALVCPRGIRVWRGRYTVVRHNSNAMQTLLTPPGDTMTVYDYKHRDVRSVAPIRHIDARIAWLWSRHDDAISGWRVAEQPLSPVIRSMFPVDWSVFGTTRSSRVGTGRYFR